MADTALTDAGGHRPRAFVRLYRGETSFDFVGRRRWWYILSTVVILAGIGSLGTRGLNLGIDFRGGTSWQVPAHGVSDATVTNAVKATGVVPASVQTIGVGSNAHIVVQADLKKLSDNARQVTEENVAVVLAHATNTSVQQAKDNITDVGPTWGGDITKKAIIAVIVFFIVVVIYISFRFEWKMAIAALLAVIHDLLVVTGVYSLSGLQVTPDTVVAVLTILGYSLYDTVVVFDRVGENSKGIGASGRITYSEVVNLSMNQTLARSMNTSLVAILPVLSVLVIGAEVLGATTLQYFGFALVIGLISGAYSSIFIASPLLAQMKEREPRYATIRQRLASRAERELLTPRSAALALAQSGGVAGRAGRRPASSPRAGGTTAARARPVGASSAAPRSEVLRPGSARARQAAAQKTTPRKAAPANPVETGSEDEVAEAPAPAARPARAAGGPGIAGTNRTAPKPRKGGPNRRKGGKRR
ncbi:MAG: protein translocase subunit SecF [Acidimicrobiales bacterium]